MSTLTTATTNAGAASGSHFIQHYEELNAEYKFGSATAGHSLHSFSFHNSDQVKFFRHRKTAASFDGEITITPGPRALGTVISIVAFWLPSNVEFATRGDVTGLTPIVRATFGGAFGVSNIHLPVPMTVDLPLWSPTTTAYPKLYIACVHHVVSDGPKVGAGHYVDLNVQGHVHFYGGI